MRHVRAAGFRFGYERWEIGDDGVGVAVYAARGPDRTYSLVCFAHDLDPAMRTDRVIAEAWDATYVLYDGIPDDGEIERLRANTPKQEARPLSPYRPDPVPHQQERPAVRSCRRLPCRGPAAGGGATRRCRLRHADDGGLRQRQVRHCGPASLCRPRRFRRSVPHGNADGLDDPPVRRRSGRSHGAGQGRRRRCAARPGASAPARHRQFHRTRTRAVHRQSSGPVCALDRMP